MDDSVSLQLLDRLAVGSVAVTARAVSRAGADLTFAQWRALYVIGERYEGVTVGEVAARVGSSASATSRLVGRLRRRGLLIASKEDADARVTRIRISEPGRLLRSQILDRRREYLTEILRRVDLSEAEANGLERLASAFGSFA